MIEVRLPFSTVAPLENDINKLNTVMTKLREAGIPVMGTLVPWAIERGTLVITADSVFEEFIYQWFDENEKVTT